MIGIEPATKTMTSTATNGARMLKELGDGGLVTLCEVPEVVLVIAAVLERV